MLPPISPKKALFACPPSLLWSLPSFTTESALSFPSSRSDPSISRQGAALVHLDSLPPHNLVIWTDGSVPFPLGKYGSGVFFNCSLCGTEASLCLSAGPVCSSFSAEACTMLQLFAGCSGTNMSVISLPFYSCLTFALFSPLCPLLCPSFYLNLSGRSGRNCSL